MTPDQFQTAQNTLSQAETELNALRAKIRDCIDKAREYNALTAQARGTITEIERQIKPLQEQCAAYVAEQRRLQAEAMKAEAAAKDKARQEAARAEAEAKAKEASEVETLRARVAELEAMKG